MSTILSSDKKYVWHPFTQMQTAPTPLAIIKAEGSVLYAEDGKVYLDCNSSWWVNIHGHGKKELKEALINQFDEIDHVIFAGVTHPKAVELSKKVISILPKNFSKVFFSDDGSTAVEVALKMAFQYWFNQNQPKKRILSIEGAYHGDTFGAMSISQRGYFNEPFEHLFFSVDYLPFPTADKETELLNQAKYLFETNEFAAIILEPLVQGSAGMCMYSVDFLQKITALAKSFGVLVIFDEVMTGWGRTGKLFAMNHISETPDIVCLSKGLTGGVLPLGLTVATENIYNAFLAEEKTKALLHGHSFTGNPLACAVACASIELTQQPDFNDNIERIVRKHTEFKLSLSEFKSIEVRQLGTIIAVEIQQTNADYFSSIRDEAYQYFLDKGLLIRPLGNIIFLNPPYCTTDEQLDEMYAVIKGFLVSKELIFNI
jgi:adenosylmethionine-8-amino-7-oxononanoate aminotransferase